MSATFTASAGLGIPSLNDTDFPTTLSSTITQIDGFLGLIGVVRKSESPSTSLNVVVTATTAAKTDGTEQAVAGGTVAMTANQTNYLWADTSGVLQKNTTGFPASTQILPLAIVVAGASTITTVTPAQRLGKYSNLAISATYMLLAGGTFTGLPVLSGVGAAAGLQFTATAAPGSPADGQVWYDSTAKCLLGLIAGSTQRFPSVQFMATASATVASTAAETTILPTGVGTTAIAANQMAAGKTVRLRASGFLSTTGTPNITINAKLGSFVVTSGAVAAGSTVTNVGFQVEVDFTCRTAGAGGVTVGQGRCIINGVVFPMVNTSTVSIVDTTITEAVALTATWSASSASNTITITNLSEEILN